MILHSKVLPAKSQHNLIFLHGLLGSHKNFLTLAKTIQKQIPINIHLLDMRNHGNSFQDPNMAYPLLALDVKSYIQSFSDQDQKWNILGHSLGGKVAMQFHQSYPTLIENSIVVDILPKAYESFSSHSIQDKTFRFLQGLKNVRFEGDVRKQINEAGAHFSQSACDLAYMGVKQDKSGFLFQVDYLLNNYMELMGSIDYENNQNAIQQKEDQKNIVRKGLFMFGKESGYVNEEGIKTLDSLYDELDIEGFEKAGHWLHAEQPKNFTDSVVRYLSKNL